jgi:hypothetical protein
MHGVHTPDLLTRIELAESDPPGVYLIETLDGLQLLLRLTGDEPDDLTLAPANAMAHAAAGEMPDPGLRERPQSA